MVELPIWKRSLKSTIKTIFYIFPGETNYDNWWNKQLSNRIRSTTLHETSRKQMTPLSFQEPQAFASEVHWHLCLSLMCWWGCWIAATGACIGGAFQMFRAWAASVVDYFVCTLSRTETNLWSILAQHLYSPKRKKNKLFPFKFPFTHHPKGMRWISVGDDDSFICKIHVGTEPFLRQSISDAFRSIRSAWKRMGLGPFR